MKDLIRIGVFTALGLILVIMLVVLFIPRHEEEAPAAPSALYIPGTYSSSIILNDQPLEVNVTVSNDKITSVGMGDLGDSQRAFYPLFEPAMASLADEVLFYQSADIVPITDYPVTTGILQQAVSAALELASAN